MDVKEVQLVLRTDSTGHGIRLRDQVAAKGSLKAFMGTGQFKATSPDLTLNGGSYWEFYATLLGRIGGFGISACRVEDLGFIG